MKVKEKMLRVAKKTPHFMLKILSGLDMELGKNLGISKIFPEAIQIIGELGLVIDGESQSQI